MKKRPFLFIRKTKGYQNLKDKFLYVRSFLRHKIRPYPLEISDGSIFLFNHILKSGGTSFSIILRKWFHVAKDYHPHDLDFPDPVILREKQLIFENNVPDLSRLKPFQIIAGHYDFPDNLLSKRFKNSILDKRIKKITFLRDPLLHRLSYYKYGKKRGHFWIKGMDLHEFLQSEVNFFANVLECSEENYKEVLESYFFIGITEDYAKSIHLLAEQLGRKVDFDIPHVNRTNSIEELDLLTKEEIENFKSSNKLDYKIYNYGKELLRRR